MSSQIAVLLDKENKVADFFNVYWIAIYIKNEDWQIQKLVPFNEEKISRGERVRAFTEEVIKVLKGCHLILGKLIIGIPYYLLTKAGYEVLEAETLSTELLEQINQDYNPNEESYEKEIAKDIKKEKVDNQPQEEIENLRNEHTIFQEQLKEKVMIEKKEASKKWWQLWK